MIKIFVGISIEVFFYFSSQSDSVWFEIFSKVVFYSLRNIINEGFFKYIIISYILTDWNAKLFNEC